jgi:hypothetical protein
MHGCGCAEIAMYQGGWQLSQQPILAVSCVSFFTLSTDA